MENARAIINWTMDLMPYLIGFDLLFHIVLGGWLIKKAVQLSAKKGLMTRGQAVKD